MNNIKAIQVINYHEGSDTCGGFAIYCGEEKRKGWSGKGRAIVTGLSEAEATTLAARHNATLSPYPIPAAKVEEIARKAEKEWFGRAVTQPDFRNLVTAAITEALASVQGPTATALADSWERQADEIERIHAKGSRSRIFVNEAQTWRAAAKELRAALASVQGGETEKKCL